MIERVWHVWETEESKTWKWSIKVDEMRVSHKELGKPFLSSESYPKITQKNLNSRIYSTLCQSPIEMIKKCENKTKRNV